MKNQTLEVSQKEINRLVKNGVVADQISFSKKENRFIFKNFYFYTNGQTAEKFEESIVDQIQRLGFRTTEIQSTNHYNNWPKDSWFEVRIRIDAYPQEIRSI